MAAKKMPVQRVKSSVGMTLIELNKKFNPNVIIPSKIEAALKELGAHAASEEEFRRLAGVGSKQLADYAEQYDDYRIKIRDGGRDKYLWGGTLEFVKNARETLLK